MTSTTRLRKKAPQLDQRSTFSFAEIDSQSPYFKIVETTFWNSLGRIYGDQTHAIKKLKEGQDRTCEIMLSYGNPLGLLVYKKKLQAEYGLEDALELKTLLLLNPKKNSGRGLGSKLFQRIDEIARKQDATAIYCTASSKVQSSIDCALKNGYRIDRVLEENKDQTTYLLIKGL